MRNVAECIYRLEAGRPTRYSPARHSVRLFPVTSTSDRQTVNHLRRGWINAIHYLGPRWVLHRANSPQFIRQGGWVHGDLAVGITCAVIGVLMLAGVI